MLLVVDVGNTNIVLGIYNNENIINTFRVETKKYSIDEIGLLICQHFILTKIQIKDIKAVVISSVVPSVTKTLIKAIKKHLFLNPFVIGEDLKINIKNLYYNPEQTGIDRLVNVAIAIKKYGTPCIVIDMGTATTIDAVNSDGDFMGGAIFPGLSILSETLNKKTALLPQIEILKVSKVIGQNTNECINAGIYYGYLGAIERILKEIKDNLGNVKVIATGGLSNFFPKRNLFDFVDENLTLEGIKLIYESQVNVDEK